MKKTSLPFISIKGFKILIKRHFYTKFSTTREFRSIVSIEFRDHAMELKTDTNIGHTILTHGYLISRNSQQPTCINTACG